LVGTIGDVIALSSSDVVDSGRRWANARGTENPWRIS